MSVPAELINVIFSFVGSDTAPLIKSFVKKVGEKYSEEFEEFDLDRDFFAGAMMVGHLEKLLKSGKAFLFPSVGDYDEFEPEIFGDENRSGEEDIWTDFKEICDRYSEAGCRLF